ncbi:galactoside alpha-(1,2)-fucosyltransferase 2-like [Mixophyes fleayi]|uniref:galactoside alpha-(1,2)-fucosyltransferase 2-like n=1 Tax=Mixophyes fleayi TaxID=3061075 RepID=UPI003F4D76E5
MALSRKHYLVWILLIFLIFMLMNLYLTSDKRLSSMFYKIIHQDNLSNVKLDTCIKPPTRVQPVSGVWTIEPRGRLGNLMGGYAVLYALSKLNGHQPYILPHMHQELSKLFIIKLPVLSQEIADRIKWKKYMLRNWMLPEYKNISGQYVQFLGTPYSWTFYHHIKEDILQEFTFHDFVVEEANAYLEKVRGDSKNVTFIGVHVRRGDYVELMPKKWKGVVAHKGYMDKAIAYYRNKYANPLFVVTSNGMDWCKENINNSLGDVHFAGGGSEASPARDFALLVHCNHTIMTIGSFGIWASIMAGGETIYLSNYTMPNSPHREVFRYEAVYLPNWIGIPADLSSLMEIKGNKNN